ncbi:MAG TPA: prealbumin-like fold domain-containing protein, partial [Beutenbergiaceae bacterium]|nr:prealbumin-like fold domain-containing protein [Beutenbergiaceae bacterium]
IAQEVTIPAETTHTYVVEVAFTFDKETGDPADLVCPEEGSGQHGGVANTALTDHNDHQAEDEDCATVEIPGEVTWQKVDRSEQHLSGSEWVLIGPNDQEITVTDCVDSADDCSGADIDGREGFFHVNDLAWGEWVLQETKAPSGYMLDATEHEFTVGPEGITIDVGQKENRPVPELEIPLTGGWSEQAFLLFGALLLGGAGTAVGVKRRFTRI